MSNVEIPPLAELDKKGLQYWLSLFLMGIRTKKGTEYAPNLLHHGIMRHYVRTAEDQISILQGP